MTDNNGTKINKRAIVLGTNDFTRGRLAEILKRGGFSVTHEYKNSESSGAIGLVELPGGPEVALLYSLGLKLLGIEVRKPPAKVSWPFEDFVHESMSDEEILHRCNDVYFYSRGVRRYRRFAVEMGIKVISSGRILLSTTVNLSMGGCFIRTLNPFAESSLVTLILEQYPFLGKVNGKVVYTLRALGNYIVHPDRPDQPIIAHPGMAVEFLPGQEKTIASWISQAEQILDY